MSLLFAEKTPKPRDIDRLLSAIDDLGRPSIGSDSQLRYRTRDATLIAAKKGSYRGAHHSFLLRTHGGRLVVQTDYEHGSTDANFVLELTAIAIWNSAEWRHLDLREAFPDADFPVA